MGYRRSSVWGIEFGGLRFTPSELGKCLVAKTPPRGLSHLEPILLAINRRNCRFGSLAPFRSVFTAWLGLLGLTAVWVPETRPWSLTCRDAGRC